jgi:biopolymer transport protein ExbD
MWRGDNRAKGGALDITPLVDLVFLLIIFFLLSTTFIVAPGIRIDLPDAASQKVHKDRQEITLSVDQTGAVYLNKDPVDPVSLGSRLSGLARENPDTTVLIRGDRNAGFGRVADILGTVKQSGLHRIAIMTQGKKGQSETKDAEAQDSTAAR